MKNRMNEVTIARLCALHIFEGLREGLSLFSGASRVAMIFAAREHSRVRIYDPQNLLRGHEPILKEIYLDSDQWRRPIPDMYGSGFSNQPHPVGDLQLAGLISRGGQSKTLFYQMWFTEHHPDMCSVGPTQRWLEHAIWLLANDVVSENAVYTGTSGYVLREYATHAIRDFIVDELNKLIGMDIQLRIYPILDAAIGISKTLEEGTWPSGKLVFVDQSYMPDGNFVIRFPEYERPNLDNHKHVRKLLQAVEQSDFMLVSDGKCIVGISSGEIPKSALTADFRRGHGHLYLNGNQICSFSDGRFHSSLRRAKLVLLEEILIESGIDPPSGKGSLLEIASEIVHFAEDKKYGCTLIIDLNEKPAVISGQHLENPPDLRDARMLELAKSLSMLDGALHIGRNRRLHGFACILDGRAIPGEDRARGARFNSALRFTSENRQIAAVVVSADRPVSVIQEGVELTAQCIWNPVSSRVPSPPTLEEWLEIG